MSQWRSNRGDLREPSHVVSGCIDVTRGTDSNVVTMMPSALHLHARAAGLLCAAATFGAERVDGAALPVWPLSRVTFAAF